MIIMITWGGCSKIWQKLITLYVHTPLFPSTVPFMKSGSFTETVLCSEITTFDWLFSAMIKLSILLRLPTRLNWFSNQKSQQKSLTIHSIKDNFTTPPGVDFLCRCLTQKYNEYINTCHIQQAMHQHNIEQQLGQ